MYPFLFESGDFFLPFPKNLRPCVAYENVKTTETAAIHDGSMRIDQLLSPQEIIIREVPSVISSMC